MIDKQFTLYMENRSGVLADVTDLLAEAKVNIEGISVTASSDVSLVQIIVNNPETTEQALESAGIAFSSQDVATIEIENKPGALAEATRRIADAGININYLYGTVPLENLGHSLLVISTSDMVALQKLWS